MTFAKSLANAAVQERASRNAQDARISERWVARQVASIKSKCVAASRRCEFSASILTDALPSLHHKEGQKQLLNDLQDRLSQLGFRLLQVTQEVSGEDAGKSPPGRAFSLHPCASTSCRPCLRSSKDCAHVSKPSDSPQSCSQGHRTRSTARPGARPISPVRCRAERGMRRP